MQMFESSKWYGAAAELQQAYENGEAARIKLALSLADTEYHHPECEQVKSQPDQRSFCFQHNKITDQSILLIHGWTCCPFEMRELGEILYQKGYNVVGPRLPGHGTKVADFAKYGQKEWEATAQKGLGIAALLGHEVIVIGESMGGALAAILAGTFPNLVRRIILCAPCFKTKDPMAELAGFKLLRLFIPKVDMKLQYDWQRKYWYNLVPTTAVAELVKVARKGRRVGPKIIAPILLIQAENDLLVNTNGAKRFFQTLTKIDPTQKRLVLFPNGHHNLTIELNPEKKQVFKWIEECIGCL